VSIDTLRTALKAATPGPPVISETIPNEDARLLVVLRTHAEALVDVAVAGREVAIAEAFLQAGGTPFEDRLRRKANAEAELLKALFRLEAVL